MIAPPYPIMRYKRIANYEFGKYVRTEFKDNESHWFTCTSSTRKAVEEPPQTRRSFIARLMGTGRRTAPEVSCTLVPCAVLLAERCEDEQSRSAANK